MSELILRFEIPVKEPKPPKSSIRLDGLVAGHSLWVPTAEKRSHLSAAFFQWKKRNGSLLSLKTARVGEDDTDGPGYRGWAYYKPDEFYAAWTKVPQYATCANAGIYAKFGVTDEQRYLGAVESVGKPPNVAAWKVTEERIRTGRTPYQDYLKEIGQW